MSTALLRSSPPKSSQFRCGLPRQLSPTPLSRLPERTVRVHPHSRSTATGLGRTHADRAAQGFGAYLAVPLIPSSTHRKLKKKNLPPQNALPAN